MRIYAYCMVGKARWAHLGTSHHIRPEPLGVDVVTSADLTEPAIQYTFSGTKIYLKRQNQTVL